MAPILKMFVLSSTMTIPHFARFVQKMTQTYSTIKAKPGSADLSFTYAEFIFRVYLHDNYPDVILFFLPFNYMKLMELTAYIQPPIAQ